MNNEMRTAFGFEMEAARASYRIGDLDVAFRHLERAHILGQLGLWAHIVTHWWMLKVGIRRADLREIVGQIARMIAAVMGWAFGWVPLGNTGGANVSPRRPMEIPAEFARFFVGYNAKRHQRRRLTILALITVVASVGFFARSVWARAGENTQVATRFDGTCTKLAGYQGAEDIVLDAERRQAYAVGGDRRSFRSGGPGRAKIWAISLDRAESQTPVDIAPPTPTTFRSFGADLHIDTDGTRRLFVASRPDGGHTIEVFKLSANGAFEHERTLRSPLLKNPNEVQAIGPDRVLVTLDKNADAGTPMEVLEGVFQQLTGKVLLLGPDESRIVADELNMANGLALSPDGRTLYVAETVGRSIVVFDRDPVTNQLTRRTTVPIDMAPDNLTVAPDGRVFIAGHPKLLTLALGYQKSEDKLSPSKVSIYDPASGGLRIVFASEGREIAASSVAIMEPSAERMLIGSAFGPHILRCELKGL